MCKLCNVFLFCLLVGVFSIGNALMAQDATPIATPEQAFADLQNGDSIFIYSGGSLGLLNVNEQTITASFGVTAELATLQATSSPTEVRDIEIHLPSSSIYVVQGALIGADRTPKLAQILRLDPASQQTELVYQASELFGLEFSPDYARAVVGSFEGEFGGSRRIVCVLLISTGICEPVLLDTDYRFGRWIDDQTFILAEMGVGDLYAVDAVTLEWRTLSGLDGWTGIGNFAAIPQTRDLLIVVANAALQKQFLIYNMDSAQSSPLAYTPLPGYIVVNPFFSPDGSYLLYSGGNNDYALVEFQSGQTILEFSASQAEWLPNNRGIIAVKRVSDQLLQIFQVDAATGAITILYETSEPVSIVLP
jgi:hypothetical protein